MTAQAPLGLTCDDARDLLPAYALEILEPEEAAAVRTHLASCPDCQRELQQFDGVVDALATAPAPAPPPPNLRARLLEEIRVAPGVGLPPVLPSSIGRVAPPTVVAVPRWAVWSLAAAAAILIVSVTALAILLTGAREERDDARTASTYLAAYLSAGGQVVKLNDATGDGDYYGHGSLVTAPDLPPLVIVGGCSPTTKDRAYRVWVARSGDRTRVGELEVSGDGDGWLEVELAESLDAFDEIGITMVIDGDQRQDVLVAQVPRLQTT